ncbi:MAG TPA: hypothetical protein VFH83_09425, partial [Spirochaetia bacterium]|nr:hypothetical protein [Spirochaetia bacterium]
MISLPKIIRMGAIVLALYGLAGCMTAASTPAAFAPDSVVFLAAAAIPGGADASADKSGLPHSLLEDGQSYQDSFDGMGSAFAYTGFGTRYVALADRGPNKVQYPGGDVVDFTTSYRNRFQIVDVAVTRASGDWTVVPRLYGTSLLVDDVGRGYTGISTAFTGADPTANMR